MEKVKIAGSGSGSSPLKDLVLEGLWRRNAVLVQILGLCPLLAVSVDGKNALALGLATVFVLTLSNGLVALARPWLSREIRIPVFVLLIASAVTVVEMLLQAFDYGLYQRLGIFLSLIVTNCVIMARAESFASRNGLKLALLDGLMMGLGFALGLLALGLMRELLSHGSAFGWPLLHLSQPVLLAALPAGAFFCYGLLVALRNYLVDLSGN